jgi:hypothetical protein
MAIEIKVPSVGESITEGSIARWIKKNGDLVRVDEPIFELETEKASTEVPAPASGKLTIKTPERLPLHRRRAAMVRPPPLLRRNSRRPHPLSPPRQLDWRTRRGSTRPASPAPASAAWC